MLTENYLLLPDLVFSSGKRHRQLRCFVVNTAWNFL